MTASMAYSEEGQIAGHRRVQEAAKLADGYWKAVADKGVGPRAVALPVEVAPSLRESPVQCSAGEVGRGSADTWTIYMWRSDHLQLHRVLLCECTMWT